MPIVGGLDIHREQLTSGYPGTVTGEVRRGQIAPADREHLRAWLARFAGRDDVAFAVEGCTGWRYVAGELAAAGIAGHAGEPAGTAAACGRKRHAKTGKTGSRHLRTLLAEGRLPGCWIPPAQILEYRALLETCHDLRREHTAQAQLARSSSIRAPRRWARAHCAPGRAWPRCGRPRPLTCHRPGNCRPPPPWTCSPPPRPGWRCCARGCGRCRPAPHRREGAGRPAVWGRAGHRTGADLLAGRGGPVLLLPQGGPVHRAGHHRLVFGPQRPARAPVPARTADAALGGL